MKTEKVSTPGARLWTDEEVRELLAKMYAQRESTRKCVLLAAIFSTLSVIFGAVSFCRALW